MFAFRHCRPLSLKLLQSRLQLLNLNILEAYLVAVILKQDVATDMVAEIIPILVFASARIREVSRHSANAPRDCLQQ